MRRISLSRRDLKTIDALVAHYEQKKELFDRFMKQVEALFLTCQALAPYVHSMKWRVKNPTHLKDKLIRKCLEAKTAGKPFDITQDNLFKRITDLVGFRILHLYTRQVECINKIVLALLKEEKWVLVEGPVARTWDNEYRDYFRHISMKTIESQKTMYTSVHYVFKANKQTQCACELQVRTLAEELWGEVDHTLNYPHKVDVLACREQIKVLARVTSSCTRLVDSIFQSHEEAKKMRKSRRQA
jgi:GTP pyrophosphokinase